eukprot:CAMPEP_0206266364 /NCGR_PEP_ID=MMETSP0047_2-20121206/30531_1 /ASSEMBLY_ACC=CAM_ASM_000192 /TAXON_ID=195065 /ORGANISM="Chroomonas mesostigmatica_cf, Strain CCMP1168" /LENGTH=44 /DNA_ID= /DNA_START= /DNA_END= /DNA_ORIENTATION=
MQHKPTPKALSSALGGHPDVPDLKRSLPIPREADTSDQRCEGIQ